MSYGLEVVDSNGIPRIVDDRITRLINKYSITLYYTVGWSTNISVPGIVNDGTWFCIIAAITTHSFTINTGSVTLSYDLSTDNGLPPSASYLLVFRA